MPKASHDRLVGWVGDALKVRVTAAPERGKANLAVITLLADALGTARECLQLVAGNASERKIVMIRGMSEKELRSRLERVLLGNAGKD